MSLKFGVKLLLGVFSVIYPFGLIFFSEFNFVLLIIMAILWGLRGIFEFDKPNLDEFSQKNSKFKKENLSEFGKFSFVLCGFFALCVILQSYGLKYLYPVLINAFLGLLFYFSLFKTPMITKFAMLKRKDMPQKVLIYTRNLTKIWIGLFAINGLISVVLACFENKIYWGVYCGAISYVLIGILFFGEIIFRKLYIKNG